MDRDGRLSIRPFPIGLAAKALATKMGGSRPPSGSDAENPPGKANAANGHFTRGSLFEAQPGRDGIV